VHEFGDPGRLKVEEVETPKPGAGEVVVKVSAASVNASDVKNVRGLMRQTTLPRIPGRDFAGVVVAGTKEFVGQEVWGTRDLVLTRDGSHATHLLIPEGAVVRRPKNLAEQAAACCGVTFVTAAYGLREAGIQSGQTVVVIGVFGGVGRAVAQIARRMGARVIGVSRSGPPGDLPGSFGEIALVNSSKEEPGETVKRLTHGAGADIVFDTVGGAMLNEGLKLMAPRGRIVEITAGRDPNVTINIRDFYHQQARLVGVDSLSLDAEQCAGILRELVGDLNRGN